MVAPERRASASSEKRGPALAPRATLRVSLFGGAVLHTAHQELELNSRKAKALIGYLVFAPDLRETRDRLVGMLWSETEDSKARASLRQLLHMTRETLEKAGFAGFSTDRFQVTLDAAKLVTDVSSALDSVQAGEPQECLLNQTRITDTLLAGLDDVDPSFGSWLQVQRENLRQRLIRGLEAQLERPGLSKVAVRRIAKALTQVDPTHEIAYQQLMRGCADAGDIAGALSSYKQLWDLLDQEYDMEPSTATQELVAAIKSGSYQPRIEVESSRSRSERQPEGTPPAAQPAPVLKLGLVVGSFESDSEHANVATALRHDLISKLVRFREWVVVDAELGSTAAQSLVHAQYRITGKLLSAPTQMALMLSLHEYPSGTVVWSERHDLQREKLAEAHQSIVNRIALSFNVHLSVDRLVRLASAPDISLEAYDRWLRAQALMQSYERESRARAAAIFRAIIENEPNFAPAYSGLAQLENSHHIVVAGIYRTLERQLKATALAKKAVTLDPLDSRAQLCLGWAHAMSDRHDLAETYFHLAHELNTDDPWTTTSAALGLAFCGRYSDGRSLADQARERVPCPSAIHWSYQAQIRFLCQEYDDCARAAQHVGDTIAYLPAWYSAALWHLGRTKEAKAEAQRFFALTRGTWHGAAAPTDHAIIRWFLGSFPIRESAARQRLRIGLESAATGKAAPALAE
ncbi:MAG: BTAD domain-containing putative transcriptional regulator [Bacteroidota bacterium]|jgi:DNA-binding SARP family transcriptional activator